jgi:DHA2 family multidrug resistance protein-like MFS transporter
MFRDARERGKAIAVWATCQFAGGALGPVLAGLLLQFFWWGSVFLVSVPAMVVLLIAGPVLLPESRGDQAGRLKPSSVGLSLAAVLLAIYGIKQLAAGSGQLGPAVALLAGGAAGVVFVRRQLQLESPLLDLRLLRSRPLAAVLVALVFAGVAMAGTGLLVTQYLQEVLGYSPAASALLFAPMGLGVAVGTMAAPGLAGRMDQRTAIAGGLAVSALGSLLLAVAGALPMVVAGITVLAVGTGPLFALGTGLVVGSVPPARAGSAASMSETANYLGGSLGFALLGVLAAAVYRSRMGGVSDSLAGAVAASRQLPAAQGAGLLQDAREAFTASLHVTGGVAVVIFAALAILVLTMRPARQATGPSGWSMRPSAGVRARGRRVPEVCAAPSEGTSGTGGKRDACQYTGGRSR